MSLELQNKTKEEIFLEWREAQRRYQTLIENIKLAVVEIDANRKIAYVNNHFCAVTGYQRQDIMGKDYFQIFIPPTDRKRIEMIHALCIAGMWEPLAYVEYDIIIKDNKVVTMGWNNTVLRDIHGNIFATNSVGEELIKKLPIVPPSSAPTPAQTPLAANRTDYVYCNTEIGDYEIGESLGKNPRVRLGIHKSTREKVAIKILKKDALDETELTQARREISILQQLTKIGNPYIARMLEAIETEDYFFIITEYAAGGEMLSYILQRKGLSEEESHKYLSEIISAIAICHQNNIIHRDIKHQNIILDSQNHIKLIDFGLSNFFEEGLFRKTFCGTPAYAPPEILLGTEYSGPEVDIWSIGVVLYSMLTAEFPFKTVTDILAGRFADPPHVSRECVDLLRGLLTVDRRTRVTLDNVLRHPWMNKFPFQPMEYNAMDTTDSPLKKRRVSLQ